MEVITEAEITCPECRVESTETMPKGSCVCFYECTKCGSIMKPGKGDYCVFCSYGLVKCPSEQLKDVNG